MGKDNIMNIVFFTGNSPRHKAFVNLLTKFSKKNLVISEVKENYYIIDNSKINIIEEHFKKYPPDEYPDRLIVANSEAVKDYIARNSYKLMEFII